MIASSSRRVPSASVSAVYSVTSKLTSEIVDFVGGDPFNQTVQIRRIGQVAVMKEQPDSVKMGVFIQMVDPSCVETAGTADGTMYLVSL